MGDGTVERVLKRIAQISPSAQHVSTLRKEPPSTGCCSKHLTQTSTKSPWMTAAQLSFTGLPSSSQFAATFLLGCTPRPLAPLSGSAVAKCVVTQSGGCRTGATRSASGTRGSALRSLLGEALPAPPGSKGLGSYRGASREGEELLGRVSASMGVLIAAAYRDGCRAGVGIAPRFVTGGCPATPVTGYRLPIASSSAYMLTASPRSSYDRRGHPQRAV